MVEGADEKPSHQPTRGAKRHDCDGGLDTAFDPFGIDLLSFDTAAFLADVTANPGAFGLTNVTDSCLFTAPAVCSTYLYFDNVHPTTAVHDLLALQFATAAGIVPEPAISGLLVIAVVGLWGLRRRAFMR